MTCVGPHVRPLSLLTAQYTLCPCAPSNHLPTPCRRAIDDYLAVVEVSSLLFESLGTHPQPAKCPS